MTSLDASFTLDLILIVFAIFVLGMIGLALAGLPDKSDYQRRMILLTALIGGVTAFYTGVSILEWNAMRTSNALIQEQLEVTDRPWIKVIGAVPSHPLIFHGNGGIDSQGNDFVNLGIKVIIQNVGRSVALNINIRANVIFVSMTQGATNNPFTYPKEMQKALCSKEDNASLPINLFPGEDNRPQTGDDHDMPVSGKTFTIPGDLSVVRIMPMFVGCVDYTIGVSGKIHQSGFIYQVQQASQAQTGGEMLIVGKDIAMSDIILRPFAFGGFDAN
jgi:hypothetical protein